MINLIPAILTQDPADLLEKIKFLESIPDITDVHIDFEDGKFVPNNTVLPKVLESFQTRLNLEGHMMVEHPEHYFHDMEHLRIKTVIMHYESFRTRDDIKVALSNASHLGLTVGLAINPGTEVTVFEQFLNDIAIAQLMSVHPGFQGQPFVSETFDRLEILAKLVDKIDIAVDGAVKLENIESLIGHGVRRIVVGSGIWGAENPKHRIEEFFRLAKH